MDRLTVTCARARAPRHPRPLIAPAKTMPDLSDLPPLMNATHGESSLYDDAMGFYHAVDWTERWLHAVGLFHLLVWVCIVATRRFTEVQMVLLFVIRAQILALSGILAAAHALSSVPPSQLVRCTVLSGSTG